MAPAEVASLRFPPVMGLKLIRPQAQPVGLLIVGTFIDGWWPVKRIVAAAVSLVMAATLIAPGADARTSETSEPRKKTAATTSSGKTATPEPAGTATRPPVRRDLTPFPVLDDGEFDADHSVQVSYVHVPTGYRVDSGNVDEIRTCLSICKIYIADHVFREGTAAQKKQATEMIRTSDDGITTRLYRAFPESIDEVAERYGLPGTAGMRTWGKSVTTTHDVATFLAAKVAKGDFDDPVLAAMADSAPFGSDGYPQDFGTAVLPGVIGTKWGWADIHDSMNASSSYGDDFVISLNVIGDADAATEVAEELFTVVPSANIAEVDGQLVATAKQLPRATAADTGAGASAGELIAGLLALCSVAGIAWPLRGRNRR